MKMIVKIHFDSVYDHVGDISYCDGSVLVTVLNYS